MKNPFRHLSLLTRISLIIAVILLAFFALSTFINYRQQRAFILGEAVEKARIIAYEAIRTREYLSRQLLIGKIDLSRERYGLIPVVASNRIGQKVAEDLDYTIHQVSSRYRNPQNAPDPFEQKVLERFQGDPRTKEDYAITGPIGNKVFRYLRAFAVEESCLECHGDPAAAPAFIKELFPEQQDRAYNYQIGEIIGAASVTIPMVNLERQVRANLRNDLIYTGGIFLALITFLGLMIRMTVTGPLAQLGQAIGTIVRTGRFQEKIPRRTRDEIGILIAGFNDMIDRLAEKTEHLEESERRFRTLTETARDGIISFLANGQIILFNRQAERIFGYSKREVLGESVSRLIHEDCRSLAGEDLADYLSRQGEELSREPRLIPGRRRDGSRIELELSISAAESDGHLFYTAILRTRTTP